MASEIVIIGILQISNWFTKKHVNKMLALYFMAQFAGYMTPLNFIEALGYSV